MEQNPAAAFLYRLLLRLADRQGVDIFALMRDEP
jgi:hypothetical protein